MGAAEPSSAMARPIKRIRKLEIAHCVARSCWSMSYDKKEQKDAHPRPSQQGRHWEWRRREPSCTGYEQVPRSLKCGGDVRNRREHADNTERYAENFQRSELSAELLLVPKCREESFIRAQGVRAVLHSGGVTYRTCTLRHGQWERLRWCSCKLVCRS